MSSQPSAEKRTHIHGQPWRTGLDQRDHEGGNWYAVLDRTGNEIASGICEWPNARLIALAPAMFQLLEEIAAGDCEYCSSAEAARAILSEAKAT